MEYATSVEAERGCGFRRAGKRGFGIYLVGPEAGTHCGRLPFPLESCPCCGGGIKPARGWTWIEPSVLLAPNQKQCKTADAQWCSRCPMGGGIPDGRHGLVWIGEKFYPTPEEFMREVKMMGVSRRLPAVPRGFVLGETQLYLAHRKAVLLGWQCYSHGEVVDGVPTPSELRCCDKAEAHYGPGIFTTFMASGLDLVVDDLENVPESAVAAAERLEKTSESGTVRIVKVIPEHQTNLHTQEADNGQSPETPR